MQLLVGTRTHLTLHSHPPRDNAILAAEKPVVAPLVRNT